MSPSHSASPALLVVFSHGKESGPNGRKIEALAEVARNQGALTLAVDYREYPSGVPHDHDAPGEADRRVGQLLATCLPAHRQLILVGSSMGGYVSAACAGRMPCVDGLFLLAPAFGMPGYAQVEPASTVRHTAIVHGWRDEVIPWQNSAGWAASARCALHLLDGDHRLDAALPDILPLFRRFIEVVGRGDTEIHFSQQ